MSTGTNSVSYSDVYGYHGPNQFDTFKPQYTNFLGKKVTWEQSTYIALDVIAAVISGPLAGVVRIAMHVDFLLRADNNATKAQKDFAKFQIIRGVTELFGFASINALIDVGATIIRSINVHDKAGHIAQEELNKVRQELNACKQSFQEKIDRAFAHGLSQGLNAVRA
jgi:hypothetical protein